MFINELGKINIISGYYGSGKTNLALNLAYELQKVNKKVAIVDLDIVNPYFRTGDYKQQLERQNIKVFAPNFVKTNLDLPSIPPEISSVFNNNNFDNVIIDLGGDTSGALSLGRFYKELKKSDDVKVFYILNYYRNLTGKTEESTETLIEIQKTLKFNINGIINNSNLQKLTTKTNIADGYNFATKVGKIVDIPVVATTYPKDIFNNNEVKELTKLKIKNLLPVDIIVKPPF